MQGTCLAFLLATSTLGAQEKTIIKSPGDTRSYEYVALANGLEAVVISDPLTDKSAAALDVNVGSGANPEHREGLAHFLEHMLFLGTKKYPLPGEYKEFISAHGGSDNAYTSFEHTNYFFTVDTSHLEPALDRFSQFFVAPLFNENYVVRERQVVHSEYTSKLRRDGRRLHDVRRELFNRDHPRARFSVGTAQTLAGKSIRDELISFYNKHYSSGLMKLVVLGKEPVPVLREWVEKYFSGVPNTGAVRQEITVPLFPAGMLPAKVAVRPLREIRSVSYTFPIEPIDPHYRTKPTRLLADLLGHEGPGSLLALLKRRGWANGLSAGGGINSRDEATFSVDIQLTEAGLGQVDTIGEWLFGYIALIGQSGLEQWRYEELAALATLRFRYAEKGEPGSYVRSLANIMHTRPPAELLRGFSLMESFQPALTARYIDQLDPSRVLVTVVGENLPVSRKSRYYGAEYGVQRLPAELVAKWRNARAPTESHLPEPNDFVPRSLSVIEPAGRYDTPRRVESVDSLELWHASDSSFGIPRTSFFVSFRSPLAYRTVRETMMVRLYLGLVIDGLNEFTYPADLAGTTYGLYPHRRGFSLRLTGYSDREERLLGKILGAIAQPVFAKDRFDVVKANLARNLANAQQRAPFRHAISTLKHLLLSPNWTHAQRLNALQSITLEQLRAFVPKLLSNLETVALSHGNLTRAKAENLATLVSETVPGVRRPSNWSEKPKVVRLKLGANYLRRMRSEHSDDSVLVYVQLGEPSLEDRANTVLLAQFLESHFYDSMRTEKKLGYVVFTYAQPFRQVPGINFIVQSPSTDAASLEAHVSAFLDETENLLNSLSTSEFNSQKSALAATVRQQDVQLSDRSHRYWVELDREEYDFDSQERFAEAIEAITRPDFERFFRERLSSPTDRRSLTILVRGTDLVSAAASKGRAATGQIIVDDEAFRAYRTHFAH